MIIVGKALAAKIKGRPDVEHLRRLYKGVGTEQDRRDALLWVGEMIHDTAYEDWGPPPYTNYLGSNRELINDLLHLRNSLLKRDGIDDRGDI